MIMTSHQQMYDYVPESHSNIEQNNNTYNQIQTSGGYDSFLLQLQQSKISHQIPQQIHYSLQQQPQLQQHQLQQIQYQQDQTSQTLQPQLHLISNQVKQEPSTQVENSVNSMHQAINPAPVQWTNQNQDFFYQQVTQPQQSISLLQTQVQQQEQKSLQLLQQHLQPQQDNTQQQQQDQEQQQQQQQLVLQQSQAYYRTQVPHPYYNGHYYPSNSVNSVPVAPIVESSIEESPKFKEILSPTTPNSVKPRIATTYWEDEKTICYQVEARGVLVSRRQDTNFVNGTKLLNVAGMSRGKRDGILKTERTKSVVRVGAMRLKGVWIPFERAAEIARNEGVDTLLYPLFIENLKDFFEKKGSQLKNWNPQDDRRTEKDK